MSLSLAIAINVFLCLNLLAALARVTSLANRLTPHVPASAPSLAATPAVDFSVLFEGSIEDAQQEPVVAVAA
jgi:uncharacterized alpha/beta hydrolase family protein